MSSEVEKSASPRQPYTSPRRALVVAILTRPRQTYLFCRWARVRKLLKSSCFERARFQPRRKRSNINVALAVRESFHADVDFFATSSRVPQKSRSVRRFCRKPEQSPKEAKHLIYCLCRCPCLFAHTPTATHRRRSQPDVHLAWYIEYLNRFACSASIFLTTSGEHLAPPLFHSRTPTRRRRVHGLGRLVKCPQPN